MSDNPETNNPPDAEPDDFANFDPDKYLRDRRAELGHPQYGGEQPDQPSRRGRRGRQRDEVEERDEGGIDPLMAVGLGRDLLRTRERREDTRDFAEILRGNFPLLRALLIGAGCLLLLVLIGLCSLAITIYNGIAHH